MTRLFTTTLMLISLSFNLGAQDCKCVALKSDESTRTGYFADVTYEEKEVRRSLFGVAYLAEDDRPLENVFVEVFTHPERWLKSHKDPGKQSKQQIRIAACKTGIDGEFCFTDIPKGTYEVRLSLDGGYGITHLIVKIDPKRRKPGEVKMRAFVHLGG